MAKKYYWTRKEETKLLDLWKKGITNMGLLASEMKRTPRAVKIKLRRLGVVVEKRVALHTTTTKIESKGLLTHEQALKVLAGALEALRKPGQDKLELQRLRILVDTIHTYDSVLEKFEKWTEIEARLLEMDKKIQELSKTKNFSS
jgi:hypothetical protein